jgi:hypothetical protein
MEQSFIVLETTGYLNTLIEASHDCARETVTALKPITRQVFVDGKVEITYDDEEIPLEPIKPLSRPRAMKLLAALVEECVSQYVRYRMARSPLPAIAAALRDTVTPSGYDYVVAEHFLCMPEVDSMVIEMTRQIGFHVAEDTWRQWDIAATPYMIGLIGGQDYRIAEWERAHGVDPDENMKLTVDISAVVNYLHTQLTGHYGEVARKIPLRAVVMDAIHRRFPKVEFQPFEAVPFDLFASLGIESYELFYEKFIHEVMDAFGVTFLLTRIDRTIHYRAEITGNFTLVFYASERPKNEEALYFHELKQSIERGDWVPERERRRLDDYERTH